MARKRIKRVPKTKADVTPESEHHDVGEMKYLPRYNQMVYQLRLLGATRPEIAKVFGVVESTIHNWMKTYPAFRASWEQGGIAADARVAAALYKRATGYSAPDTHVAVYEGKAVLTPITKVHPPDVGAGRFWLGIRRRFHPSIPESEQQPEQTTAWTETKEISGPDRTPLIPVPKVSKVDTLSDEQIDALLALVDDEPENEGE